MVTTAMKFKDSCFLEEKLWQPRQHIKKQRHNFANKGLSSPSYHFSSSHVRMWELDHKESRTPKNWCFLTVVLQKTLESPLDSKEIKPLNPKGNHSWIFIRRTDAEAEAPIFWPSDTENWLIRKDPAAGKDWSLEEKETAEDEMVHGSPTRWSWFWTSSRSWWWSRKFVMLQSLGWQRVKHDWVTELLWI